MSLDIVKSEMDEAWRNRNTSQKFYNYCYQIAEYQVSKKGIRFDEREDFVQFAIYKCYMHQDSYKPGRGSSTYSFFWKQISLSIAYKQRKQARKKNKINVFYIEQEKVLDYVENIQTNNDGESINDIVGMEEAALLKQAFKKYNRANTERVKPSKDSAKKVIKWMSEKDPTFIHKFEALKPIFNNWLASMESYNKATT